MDNQHRKISGYRELTQEQIDLMNEVKALGPQVEEVLLKVQAYIAEQRKVLTVADHERLEAATPERFAALAKTDLQTGLMYMTRAIAQPGFF